MKAAYGSKDVFLSPSLALPWAQVDATNIWCEEEEEERRQERQGEKKKERQRKNEEERQERELSDREQTFAALAARAAGTSFLRPFLQKRETRETSDTAGGGSFVLQGVDDKAKAPEREGGETGSEGGRGSESHMRQRQAVGAMPSKKGNIRDKVRALRERNAAAVAAPSADASEVDYQAAVDSEHVEAGGKRYTCANVKESKVKLEH